MLTLSAHKFKKSVTGHFGSISRAIEKSAWTGIDLKGSSAPLPCYAIQPLLCYVPLCLGGSVDPDAPSCRDHGRRRRWLLPADGRGRGGHGAGRAGEPRRGATGGRRFRGRIVKTMGDGVLLEFPSVVAAVECGIEIQKMMLERNRISPNPNESSTEFGVNLGDVLIDGDDILGR